MGIVKRFRKINGKSSKHPRGERPKQSPHQEPHLLIEASLLRAIAWYRDEGISPVDILTGLCRVTAFSAAALEVPEDDLLRGMAELLSREKQALEAPKEPA